MKWSTVFSVLLATTAAQSTLELIPVSSRRPSFTDVEPSATQSISGPVQTERACAQIASAVERTSLRFPSVAAELALACLKSVPISQRAASSTINAIKQMVEFQSTITYLKDPPKGWPNERVDIVAGLDTISKKVDNGEYSNEYDFETDIASLFVKAHDGHLGFNGMAYSGAFRWRRSSRISLISASRDGREMPKVWATVDFNTTNANFQPSAVTQINGEDVVQFLEKEAQLNAYHDPDTRYNAMFFMAPAENFGYFANPRFYPGPSTSVTYENGTTQNYTNAAVVLEARAWRYITSPQSFYDTYITPSTSSLRLKNKRNPNALPHNLENPRDHEFHNAYTIQHGSIPANYPRPFVAHTAPLTPLAGYFINTAQGQIGVLVVQTFNTDDAADARQFQRVIQRYIAEAQSRNVAKHIIDVRTNGGGKVLSGYDMYLQFFPSQRPQTQSRYRGHRASEIFGASISSYDRLTIANAELFTSPFSNDAWLSANLTRFGSWNEMYPPTRFNNDNFTTLLKYNLSDPLTTSNDRLAVGIVPTGYGNRNNFTTDPFKAEDIVILSDGICASTCSIFLELMVQQSRVRTLTVGGRPRNGPMVPVGGTKGTLVLPYQYLQTVSAFISETFATGSTQRREWADFLPQEFAINVQDASVNFQDNIRKGLENDGIPTQFLNDTSSCRLWYTPEMYLNVTRLWERTAAAAFGGSNGGIDAGACVNGSVSSREQQTGLGEGNPATGQGPNVGSGQDGTKKAAAVGLRVEWGMALGCAVIIGITLGWI